MQNPVRRDAWRDANRSDSTDRGQKTRHLEWDMLALSGTEKSVALRHEESEDPTLIRRLHDEMGKMMQTHSSEYA